MKNLLLPFTFLFLTLHISAQSEETAIRETLQRYLEGSSHNDPDLITSAFYDEADLFLSKKDQELWVLSPSEYAALFTSRKKGEFNGRVGKILAVDHAHVIASAKAEILIPKRNMRFIDIFLLKKIGGEWKIISKAATLMEE